MDSISGVIKYALTGFHLVKGATTVYPKMFMFIHRKDDDKAWIPELVEGNIYRKSMVFRFFFPIEQIH